MNQKGIFPVIIFVGFLVFGLLGVLTLLSRNPNMPVSGMTVFTNNAFTGFLFLLGGAVLFLIGALVIVAILLRMFLGGKKGSGRIINKFPFKSSRKNLESIYKNV